MSRLSENVITTFVVFALVSLVAGIFTYIYINATAPDVYSGFSIFFGAYALSWGDLALVSGIVLFVILTIVAYGIHRLSRQIPVTEDARDRKMRSEL